MKKTKNKMSNAECVITTIMSVMVLLVIVCVLYQGGYTKRIIQIACDKDEVVEIYQRGNNVDHKYYKLNEGRPLAGGAMYQFEFYSDGDDWIVVVGKSCESKVVGSDYNLF